MRELPGSSPGAPAPKEKPKPKMTKVESDASKRRSINFWGPPKK